MSTPERYSIHTVYPSPRVAALIDSTEPLFRVIDNRTGRTVPFGQYSDEEKARARLQKELER